MVLIYRHIIRKMNDSKTLYITWNRRQWSDHLWRCLTALTSSSLHRLKSLLYFPGLPANLKRLRLATLAADSIRVKLINSEQVKRHLKVLIMFNKPLSSVKYLQPCFAKVETVCKMWIKQNTIKQTVFTDNNLFLINWNKLWNIYIYCPANLMNIECW